MSKSTDIKKAWVHFNARGDISQGKLLDGKDKTDDVILDIYNKYLEKEITRKQTAKGDKTMKIEINFAKTWSSIKKRFNLILILTVVIHLIILTLNSETIVLHRAVLSNTIQYHRDQIQQVKDLDESALLIEYNALMKELDETREINRAMFEELTELVSK